MLLVKSFAILGMLFTALQLIHSVGFAMLVVGSGALIVLPLVLLRSLLVLARRILTSQSVANVTNCLTLVITQSNTELNRLLLSFFSWVSLVDAICACTRIFNISFVLVVVYFTTRICYCYYFHPRPLVDIASC